MTACPVTADTGRYYAHLDDEAERDALFDRVVSNKNISRLAERLRFDTNWVSFRFANDEAFCNAMAEALTFKRNDSAVVVLWKTATAEARRLLERAATQYAERRNPDDGAQEPDAGSIDLSDAS